MRDTPCTEGSLEWHQGNIDSKFHILELRKESHGSLPAKMICTAPWRATEAMPYEYFGIWVGKSSVS